MRNKDIFVSYSFIRRYDTGMKVLKKILGMILFIGIVGCFPVKTNANEVGFSVEPILPKNQIDRNKGYFHLLLDKGQKQTLEIKLKNFTTEPLHLTLWTSNAKTNMNGIVDYSDKVEPDDASLLYPLTKSVKAPNKIEMKPESEEILKVDVEMPNVPLEGIIAGGLTIEETKTGSTEAPTLDTTIKNKFSYVVAMLLQQEEVVQVTPEVSLSKVYLNQINTKNAVVGEVTNLSSVFVNNVTIKTRIIDEKTREVVFDSEVENKQIAPNSTMKYPTFLNGKKIKAGNYVYQGEMSGVASDDDERLSWTLETPFTIQKEEASKLNDTGTDTAIASDSEGPFARWMWLILLFNVLFILGVISYLMYRKQQSKKKKKRKKKKKHNKKA